MSLGGLSTNGRGGVPDETPPLPFQPQLKSDLDSLSHGVHADAHNKPTNCFGNIAGHDGVAN